ncbi:MAG TPA: BTAD domain-containing putative transcriptional regulator [Pilimelia sp.]|nr:BTAD domain-containing putative transcriptional regulator [Pilimelia sp.]
MAEDAGSLRFGLLGTVTAARGAQEIKLGSAKQRAVLAVLLLQANRTVSRHEIIDCVWGPAAPPSVTNLVATYVAGLRRAIEPGRPPRVTGDVLTSAAGGYALYVAPGQLDVEAFEGLAARARQLVADGDLAGAVDALDRALALWRGQPLDGITGPFAASERRRLTERRIAVIEERIEVGLAAGEHAASVAELTRLVAAHPYRERLRALLMRALYRCGRQAEALAVFDDARRTLVDQLGIEPGPELQTLHRQILLADSALLTPPATAARGTAAMPRPAQLPAAVADFTGRGAQVSRISRWLVPAPAADDAAGSPVVVVAVTGPGGAGKTTLAVHVAHLVREQFPDGQLYADLQGCGPRPARPADVLGRFLHDLGVEPERCPADLDGRAAMFRSLLTGRRMLILLDDAGVAGQVQPLVPGGAGSAVVVTSRARLAPVPGARTLDLDTFDPDEALALLARIVGARRVEREPAAARDVLAACGGLPLAVRIAGERLASRPAWSVRTLADRLRRTERRLTELRTGNLGVRGSFEVSYAALPGGADGLVARAFRLLGVVDVADVPVGMVAALLDGSLQDAEDALEALVDVHLLESPEPGRYRLHVLLHLFAREQALACASPAALATAVARAAHFYLTGVRRADRLLRPGRIAPTNGYSAHPAAPVFTDEAQAIAWLERERGAIVGVTLQAARREGVDPLLVSTLLTDLRAFLHRRGYWDDLWQLCEAARAAAERVGHVAAAALAYLELGTTTAITHRLPEAVTHLRHSLALFRQIGDVLGETRALNNLSVVAVEQRDFDGAVRLIQEELVLLRQLGDPAGESIALDNLALAHVRLGRCDEAVPLCRRSAKLNRALGSAPLAAAPLNVLGLAYSTRRRYHRAAWCQRRSHRLARTCGNRYREAQALIDLAEAYRRGGRPRRALSAADRAIALERELGDVRAVAQAMLQAAGALNDLGRRPLAQANRAQAAELLRDARGDAHRQRPI